MTNGTLDLTVLGANRFPAPYDVFGQIEPFGAEGSVVRDIIVPTSYGSSLAVDLQPGVYNVRLFLPGARVLQQACRIAPGKETSLVFTEPEHVGFSLQQASGTASFTAMLAGARSGRMKDSVMPRPKRRAAVKAKSNTAGVGRMVGRNTLVRYGGEGTSSFAVTKLAGIGNSAPVAKRTVAKVATAKRAAPAASKNVPKLRVSRGESLTGASAWEAAVSVTGFTETVVKWSEVQPAQRSGRIAIWRLGENGAFQEEPVRRYWAKVMFGKSIELISVPMPWVSGSELCSIDILVDGAVVGNAATSIAVNDPQLDSLLSYLDRGRLAGVRPVIDSLDRQGVIERAINAKRRNPIAACAAAYAGLALFDPGEEERWDSWLRNIMDWFPWLPDGGIVHARRIMLRPQHPTEHLDAFEALQKAYRAGIPYFSVGLQLMRDMLEMFAEAGVSGARELSSDVSRVAARSDPKPLFTVLRYPS